MKACTHSSPGRATQFVSRSSSTRQDIQDVHAQNLRDAYPNPNLLGSQG
ncbi:MAG: hypothetical protein QXM34_01065 [Zestosphaera sp.]